MKVDDKEYVLNPSLNLSLDFSLRARNRDFKFNQIDLRGKRELSKLLLLVAKLRPGTKRLPKEILRNIDFYIETRLLVPADEIPEKVPNDWRGAPDILNYVPRSLRIRAQAAMAGEHLVFNAKNVALQAGSERPKSPHPGLPPNSSFPYDGPHLWVYDERTQMWATYLLRADLMNAIGGMARGKISPAGLTEIDRELLVHARVLVPANSRGARARAGEAELKALNGQLRRRKFAVVRGMLQPLQIAILRRYFRALEEQGYMEIDPDQVINKRFYRHNDPLLRFIHRQSGRLARAVTGQPILPSYSFVSAYLKGAELKKHRDRPQCAWNGSVLIDENPEVDIKESWPIYLQTPQAVHEIRLDFGDVLFYSGTELAHWRENIGRNHRQTLGLLHYVPLDFVGDLD